MVQREPQLIPRDNVFQDRVQIQAVEQDGESRLLAMLSSLSTDRPVYPVFLEPGVSLRTVFAF